MKMQIGAQFYTIRDFCRDLNALDESLKKVADIGFKYIQLSGVCPYEADWMKERLDKYGLSCQLTHFDWNRVRNETKTLIHHHDVLGCKYIGIGGYGGWGPELTEEKIHAQLASMVEPTEKIFAAGHKYMVHTHDKEFYRMSDGRLYIEHLCDYAPAEKMGITLDTYWAHAAGADPAVWLRKLKGRVNCVHFKDMAINQAKGHIEMAPIGEGLMNYDAILSACEDADVEYGFIEQDDCNGQDAFDCLRRSYNYFKALGYFG